MPNGHGGIPWFGRPLLYAIGFAILAWRPVAGQGTPGWIRVAICLALAALIGWRVAFGRHMWHATEYDGAYTPNDAFNRAQRRYRIAAPIYALVAVCAAYALFRWRGLP